ncbi:MAG: trehalose-phosphatase [Casimicrobiaceae bacterium]
MKYALSPVSLAHIRRLLQGRPMLAFDIDGTLAPIVAEPWRARISDELRAGLRSLAARTPVAIVTGRAVKDARPMLGFSPHYLVGNHGAEGIPGFDAQSTDFQRVCAAWLAELSAAADASGWRATPGIMLEDKQYSLSFHYRHVARPALARQILEQRVARLIPPPDIVHGKRVLNLLAPDAPHKGEALLSLLGHSGCARALYVGDDVTDEDVFRMRTPEVLSIRVGRKRKSAADMYLKNQADVARLVRRLVAMLDGAQQVARQHNEAAAPVLQ